jgi:hypothetical protein
MVKRLVTHSNKITDTDAEIKVGILAKLAIIEEDVMVMEIMAVAAANFEKIFALISMSIRTINTQF